MLSVATVVFNDPDGLQRTIDSVRAHKDKGADIEFVVADGGSRQETLSIIDEQRDVIDVVVDGPDDGIYDGMNKLLVAASGDSILFINAGDVLYEHMDLASIMKFCELDKKNYFGKVVQRYNDDCYMRPKSIPGGIDLKDISHQAFLVPKKVYKLIFYDLNYAVSSDRLWIKACIGEAETVYIDEVISVFYLGGVSNSSSFRSLVFKCRDNIPLSRKSLQFFKLLLRMFCSQAFYYRIIYFFKYRYFRCEGTDWSMKL